MGWEVYRYFQVNLHLTGFDWANTVAGAIDPLMKYVVAAIQKRMIFDSSPQRIQ